MRLRIGSESGSSESCTSTGPPGVLRRKAAGLEPVRGHAVLVIGPREANCAADLRTHQWRSSTGRNAPLELRQRGSSYPCLR